MKLKKELTLDNSTKLTSSFVSTKENFIHKSRRNKKIIYKNKGKFLGNDTIETNEIIYQNLSILNKFKDSKILLVGAGPTTNEVDWNPDNYDYIWSCNKFYLNKKLQKCNISLVSICKGMDISLKNKQFHNYIKNNNTICCFEHYNKLGSEIKWFFDMYQDRCFYSYTRYLSKIGAIPRLLCTATLFRAREIHVVGMDGVLGKNVKHSFEGSKKPRDTYSHNLDKKLYETLWDYLIHDIGKNVIYRNLGEGHPHNLSTGFSKKYFPLNG